MIDAFLTRDSRNSFIGAWISHASTLPVRARSRTSCRIVLSRALTVCPLLCQRLFQHASTPFSRRSWS
jgi:hypothetical protein